MKGAFFMIKMWKRLICVTLSVLMIMSVLPVGIVADEETALTYPTASDGVMTTIPLTSSYIGSSSAEGTYAEDGSSVTYSSFTTVSYKLPSSYTAGTTIYVHVTGTNGDSNNVRAYLIPGTDNNATTPDVIYMTPGSFDVWTELTVATGYTASEILFKGYQHGAVITSLTITSIEIYVGTADEYKAAYCAKNGHNYVDGVCSNCGDHCTNLLSADKITVDAGTVTVTEDGTFSPDSSTTWIAVGLDKSYAIGEEVTIHISGSTGATVRWYLSAANSGYGNITAPVEIYSGSGDFDVTYTFTVGDGGSDGTEALYLFIKPPSGTYNYTDLTITHLGVVQYDVGVSVSGDSYGSVTADKTRAGAGETVSLTVAANDSCRLVSLSVTDSTGAEVELSDTYTFTMPASDVTVTAVFDNYCATYGHSYKNGVCTVCGATYTATTGTVTSSVSLTDSSVSKMTGGTLTVADGSASIVGSDASGFFVDLGHTFEKGTTVRLTITGTTYDNFRIALSSEAKDGDDYRDGGWTKVSDISGSGVSDTKSTGLQSFSFTVDITLTEGSAGYLTIKAKSYDSYIDTTLTINSITITSSAPTFFGRSLNLDGEIGVTYYFDMDGVLDVDNYKLYATVGDGTQQTISSTETCTINGTEYYCYTVYVKPTEIDSTIVAYLSDGTNTVKASDYSVYSYCSYAITTAGWESEKELCEAVLNYGYYAQLWQNESSSIDIKTNLDSSWTNPVADNWTELEGYGSTTTDGVKKTLALGSGVYIRMYLTEAVASDATFTVNGETLEKVSSSDYEGYTCYIEFKVSAKNMYDTYTVYKNGEEFTSYSVYAYINNICKSETSETITANLKNLCQAIYYYGEQAKSYNSWQ